MEIAKVNGVRLEYEVVGSGEPVLLISPVLADGFLPLLSQPALRDYRLIRYHKRGWVGSTHTPPPVTIADHAADAAALLDHLDVPRAHVAGHSSGAAVAAQLALDHPETVHTLMLLELSALGAQRRGLLPAGRPCVRGVRKRRPRGRVGHIHERRERPRLESVPIPARGACSGRGGAGDQGRRHTFFGIELPALAEWVFGPEQAAAIHQPVLSVRGTQTQPLWVEVADFLRSSLPHVDDCTIDGVGHLLHVQDAEPVARGIARFLMRNRLAGG